MIKQLKEYILENMLLADDDRVLMAVSGGLDSMVMTHLFLQLGYSFAVAHCNFMLRGEESDGDKQFVEKYCRKNNIEFFKTSFNTANYAESKSLSVQMAARELRYKWFEEIRYENSFSSVAVAHNSDDILETFFINLARGTGLKGLTGIKPVNGKIIRPLLFATRDQISEYAEYHNIKHREDSSNIETKYKRNRIRHNILPEFRELNPSFSSTMKSTISRLTETHIIFSNYIESLKSDLFTFDGETHSLLISDLTKLDPIETLLYEIFKVYNIGFHQVEEIEKLLKSESGRQFETPTHTILNNRGRIIINPQSDSRIKEIKIGKPSDLVSLEYLECTIESIENFKILKDDSIGCIDYNKLSFPLTVRSWEDGDWFYPLGSNGKKKLSDFFADIKIPNNKKHSIPILVSNNNIVWIAGYRLDDRYKITDSTNRVLIVRRK